MTYKYQPPKWVDVRESRRSILEEFDRWDAQAGEKVISDFDLPYAKDGTREAVVRFVLRGVPTVMRIDAWPDFATNLRCAQLNIRDMRLTEARGGGAGMREAYMMLAAPANQRDPYEVLGVRSDSPIEVVDGAYKALAKKHHPDTGGDPEVFKAVQAAWEAVKP